MDQRSISNAVHTIGKCLKYLIWCKTRNYWDIDNIIILYLYYHIILYISDI